jgi:formylmethanofuran dehydrogenase subunit E
VVVYKYNCSYVAPKMRNQHSNLCIMQHPDCYFFVDMKTPEEERTMSVMCVKCHDEKMPETGWFYRGSVEGYGPFTYKCEICGELIYSPDQQEGEEKDDE